jgi:hypothetical protein
MEEFGLTGATGATGGAGQISKVESWSYTKDFRYGETNSIFGEWSYTITVSHPAKGSKTELPQSADGDQAISSQFAGNGSIRVEYTYHGHNLIIEAQKALEDAQAILEATPKPKDPADTAYAIALAARNAAQNALDAAEESAVYITPVVVDPTNWSGNSLPRVLSAYIRRINQNFTRAEVLAQYDAKNFLESLGYKNELR